jgi:hypothetical protein
MLSFKGRGRHSAFGTIYYWCLMRASQQPLGFRWSAGPRTTTCSFRHVVLDCSHHRADSVTSALAQLDQAAHHRYGFVFHSNADGILRRQWQAPATLERASSDCVLVVACWARNTAHCACFVEASAGTARKAHGLRSGFPCLSVTTLIAIEPSRGVEPHDAGQRGTPANVWSWHRAGIFGTAATATAYCGTTDPQLNAC